MADVPEIRAFWCRLSRSRRLDKCPPMFLFPQEPAMRLLRLYRNLIIRSVRLFEFELLYFVSG